METRWIILLVLFVVRTVMGLQFQSVASISPFYMADLGIDKDQVLAARDSDGADSQPHLGSF